MRNLVASIVDKYDVPNAELNSGSVDNIFQIVFAIVGMISLIVLLLASLKYVISRGDPSAVAKAKNTILYAVIGLVIASASFAIVSFVVDKV